MAVLAPRLLATAGVAPVEYAASNGGDTVTNTRAGNLFVRARNASAGNITVTVASPGLCSHGGTHPLAIVVPAGASRDIGPLPSARFGQAVALTYSAYANLFIDPLVIPG